MQISEVHKSLTAFNNRSTKSQLGVKNKGIRNEWRTIKREEARDRDAVSLHLRDGRAARKAGAVRADKATEVLLNDIFRTADETSQ